MQLIKYDQACKAIAEARTIDEVKDMADKSEAMRAYARQAKNKELEIHAAEIRIRAERRLGELLRDSPKATGGEYGGKTKIDGSRKELSNPTPTLADIGIDKKLSSKAQKLAAVPEKEFEGMIGEWREKVSKETERVTTKILKRGEREQRDKKLDKVELPEGVYDLLYADPPWKYQHSKTTSRDIENQYPTMELEDICSLEVPAAKDCVLFLWATSPKLEEALQVLNAWGFEYRTCAVWDKEIIGMGYYFRQQHELLLIGTVGTPGTPEEGSRISSVIKSKRQKHSKKPEGVYEIIENMYPDSRKLEMFARNARNGWSLWGNEINEQNT